MKKLSEYKNEEALEVLADIVDPLATIAQDTELMQDIKENYKKGSERPRLIAKAIKGHTSEVIAILAALEHTPVEDFKCNLMTLPLQILNVLNDEDLRSYFLSYAGTEDMTSSGSATENTEDEEPQTDS